MPSSNSTRTCRRSSARYGRTRKTQTSPPADADADAEDDAEDDAGSPPFAMLSALSALSVASGQPPPASSQLPAQPAAVAQLGWGWGLALLAAVAGAGCSR